MKRLWFSFFVIIKDSVSTHAYTTTHHAVIPCSFIILRYGKPFLFGSSFKTCVNSKYQSQGPIYILHLLALAEISLFNVFWGKKKKTGFGIAIKESEGCGILVKKEQECGIRTPPSRPCFNTSVFYATSVNNTT